MADRPGKCSSCDIAAQVVLEGSTPQKVVCPQCGMSESYEDVQQSVSHQALAHGSKELGKAFSDIAKGNRNIRYEPGSVRSHRPNFRVEFSEQRRKTSIQRFYRVRSTGR